MKKLALYLVGAALTLAPGVALAHHTTPQSTAVPDVHRTSIQPLAYDPHRDARMQPGPVVQHYASAGVAVDHEDQNPRTKVK